MSLLTPVKWVRTINQLELASLSNLPASLWPPCKCNLISTLLEWPFAVCKSYLKMDVEFHAIKHNFLQNEFPFDCIDSCNNQFLNKNSPTVPTRQVVRIQVNPTSFALFKLHYLGSISHHIEKEFHQNSNFFWYQIKICTPNQQAETTNSNKSFVLTMYV